ncbi:MAG TPA: hydrogenase formation protein HypD [Phycisphaerae bacterium]|nr:hydrogenase formation protein HypD [Phycisphaerae bacterium]
MIAIAPQSLPTSRSHETIAQTLDRLRSAAAAIDRRISLMEVCGTHTMSAFRSGLHSLLPDNITLLSGPGCPVCVTAQSDIDLLLQFTRIPNVTLCTYGDMLRVPSRNGSLERARANGADIRVIYSTLDAIAIAQQNPEKQIVLGAVGFETTAPATAAAVLQAEALNLPNFSVFASHKRVVPAMMALLESGDVHVDGFLLPGHVSAIIGVETYRPIIEEFHLPCVVAGFEEAHMAAAIATLAELIRDNRIDLLNDYPEAVNSAGNPAALQLLDQVFQPADVRWRALGVIPNSGLALRPQYATFDAQRRFNLQAPLDAEPPGCICGRVITGAATPHQCKLFATACTPVNPIGPCMVSSEGTCQAWFKYARFPARFSGSLVPSRGVQS